MGRASFDAYDELVFHVGLHKTGTSYLQALMRANAGVLRQAGLHYPEHRNQPRAARADGNHSRAVRLVRPGAPLAQALGAELDLRSRCAGLLLSAEAFTHDSGIAALCGDAELRARRTPPRIIIYLRRYDDLTESIYAQLVKGSTAEPFNPPYYGLEKGFVHRIAPLIAAFGKGAVTLRPYNPRHWPDGNLAADFCAALVRPGLWPLMTEQATTRNVRLSRSQTWLLAQIPGRSDKKALLAHFAEHPLPVPPDPAMHLLSPRQREEMNRTCLALDRAMFADMGIRDPVDFLDLETFDDAANWTPFQPDLAALQPYLADFQAQRASELALQDGDRLGNIVRKVRSLPEKIGHSMRMKLKNF